MKWFEGMGGGDGLGGAYSSAERPGRETISFLKSRGLP